MKTIKENKDKEKDSFWNKTKARGDNPEEVFKLYHDRVRNRTAYIIHEGYYIQLPTKEIRDMLGISKEKIVGSELWRFSPKNRTCHGRLGTLQSCG